MKHSTYEQDEVDEIVRHALKTLKSMHHRAKRAYENYLYLALTFPSDIIVYRGESWHQLALQSIDRVDYSQAIDRFAKAKAAIDNTKQPLAYARLVRDEAWFAAHCLGETERGFQLITQALEAHEKDLKEARGTEAKAKGRRQKLITQTYAWRIAYITNAHPYSLNELLRVIEHEGREFYVRDQLVILKFLIPRVGLEERLRLQLRASQLNALHSSSLLGLPYRTVQQSITIGLSRLRWLEGVIRKE